MITKVIFSNKTSIQVKHPGHVVDMNEKFNGTQLELSTGGSKLVKHSPNIYVVDLEEMPSAKPSRRILGRKFN
jgi:hypothetical protein